MDPESQPSLEKYAKPRERQPANEVEKQAFGVYQRYFGPDWQNQLRETLFVDVRSASEEDRRRVGPRAGWVETIGEETVKDNRLVKNNIIIHDQRGAGDFPLRTEVGEALWNLLENSAVTQTIPRNRDGIASGFKRLMSDTVGEKAIAEFSGEILDRWARDYQEKPNRYSGMNPNSVREYNNIPEWKSEGFADGIAVEIRRRSGQALDPHEQQIWNSFNYPSQEILKVCADVYLPPVTKGPGK